MGMVTWTRTAGQLTFRIKYPNRRPAHDAVRIREVGSDANGSTRALRHVRARSGCVSRRWALYGPGPERKPIVGWKVNPCQGRTAMHRMVNAFKSGPRLWAQQRSL